MDRSGARELAFKLLYSLEIQKPENIEEQIELYIESNNITSQNAKINEIEIESFSAKL